MPTIKLTTEETVKQLFHALVFRTKTETKDVQEIVNLLLNMAVSARKKGKTDYSNKLIKFAINVKNCYGCSFQASKKARKVFMIKDFKEC